MIWTAEQIHTTSAMVKTYGSRNVRRLAGKRGTGWMLVQISLPAGLLEVGVSPDGAIHTPSFTRSMFPREVGRA